MNCFSRHPSTLSLLHINIHPLRRNSLDDDRNRPSSNHAIFAAPAQCFSAFSLQVTTNPSILCAPAQCFRAGAPPLSLLHINIHPLRRNSFDAGVTEPQHHDPPTSFQDVGMASPGASAKALALLCPANGSTTNRAEKKAPQGIPMGIIMPCSLDPQILEPI